MHCMPGIKTGSEQIESRKVGHFARLDAIRGLRISPQMPFTAKNRV